jgi:hypothetical protein
VAQRLKELMWLAILKVLTAGSLIIPMEEAVRPYAIVPNQTFTKHLNNLLEEYLIAKHPQHFIEGEAHLTLK